MRKVLFIVSNRVHLARQKKLLDLLSKKAELLIEEVKIDLPNDAGEKEQNMDLRAAECYIATGRFISAFDPDIVLIRGDRFEMLPVAMVAAYRGKIIAHIEGGDLSSSIDDTVRHAITKLSHIHFPTNEEAKQRVIQMGEDPTKVFNFGSLDCEFAFEVPKKRLIEEPYILVLHHEIKGEEGSYRKVIEAVKATGMKHVSVKSNNDFLNSNGTNEFSPENFIRLLWGAKCLIGNSSSGIKESSVLGVPVFNLGARQEGRLRPSNVQDIEYDEITGAINSMGNSRFTSSNLYYEPNTAENISNVLATIELSSKKEFHD